MILEPGSMFSVSFHNNCCFMRATGTGVRAACRVRGAELGICSDTALN